ncbi:MAG: NAD(P)-dependent oxidoreductase [Candidatus Melainabacteria bacterium]|nr:NAD(P)-dependent oxidoreductase [Candidatus Melainabacteria bacterium]
MNQEYKFQLPQLWDKRRVLLTGATGFLGSHLARKLVELNAQVWSYQRRCSGNLSTADLTDKIQIVEGHCLDSEKIGETVSSVDPEIVFHMAASGVSHQVVPETLFQVNTLGTLAVAQACAAQGRVRRFVYLGSCAEYGPGFKLTETSPLSPSDLYGASKADGHHIVHALRQSQGLPAITVRPFATYGPWCPTSRLISHAIVSTLQGKDIQLRANEQQRDFIFVDDVINGLLLTGVLPNIEGKTFNLSTGRATSAKQVVEMILEQLHHPVKMFPSAMPLRPGEILQQSGDSSLARELLGWSYVVDLELGLRKTIDWWKSNIHLAAELVQA